MSDEKTDDSNVKSIKAKDECECSPDGVLVCKIHAIESIKNLTKENTTNELK